MTNLSPNLEILLQDKSIGSTPLDSGSAGFILAAQWGAVNKVMTITDSSSFKKMYGIASYPTNHISWSVISEYINYQVGAAKVCRIAKDDYTSKNAVKMVNADLSLENWANGTDQFRKLNSADESFTCINAVKLTLTADPTGTWTVGETISKSGDATIHGTLEAIILNADNTGTKAYAYLNYVEGTFVAGNTVTNGTNTAVIDTAGVTTITKYDTYLREVELTVGTNQINKVGIGSTIVKGSASGLVIGKSGTTKLYVANVSGTFTTGDLTSCDGVTYESSIVAVSAVGSTSAKVQVLMFYAKYPGSDGNDIQVAFCNRADYATAHYSGTKHFKDEFSSTSLATDEVVIIVTMDGDIVERHLVSLDESATAQGGVPLFIDKYLEAYSNYIGSTSRTTGTIKVSDLDDLTVGTGFFALTSLAGGASGTVGLTEAYLGYDELAKKSNKVSFAGDFHELDDMSGFGTLMTYAASKCTTSNRMRLVMTLKKDAINPLSFDVATSITDITSISNFQFFPYYEWKQYYNADLKRKYYIPLTGDHIALIIKTINTLGDIEAPAGIDNNRGVLQNVTNLYYNLEEGDGSPVSELYKYGVNADVYREDDAGNTYYCMWGNRTKYNPLSDLSRINVVNALLTDMQKLGNLINPYIFVLIDEDSYNLITNTCDKGYLQRRATIAYDTLDGDGGYQFICDKSNNDSQARKEKTIYMDFYVKYKSAAEYLKLQITVAAAGVDFKLI